MEDPVSTSDGHSYERSNIEAWFVLGHRTSPLSNQVLRDLSLTPNHALRSAIREWDEARTLANATAARSVARSTLAGPS